MSLVLVTVVPKQSVLCTNITVADAHFLVQDR